MTTTYTFDQLKEDVRKEAEALRVHATKEELAKLDINKFDSGLIDMCIYGLMCSHCRNIRALELIRKCCKAYIRNDEFRPITGNNDWSSIYVSPEEAKGRNGLFYLSTIEAYIMLPQAKNATLIAFLKGETENLEL